MNTKTKPTILFVHGAFAESSSWDKVISILLTQGYPVVAVANPLRGLQSDAAYISTVINSTEGPVVLVGHSYGGMLITNVPNGHGNVQALIYVAGFAPDVGESAIGLSGRYPGSTLGDTLSPVTLPDGSKDLYIQQDKFWAQFAADVPEAEAQLMAATQRPINDVALNEGASEPAWRTVSSWFIYGDLDKNIPPAALAFMAERAGASETVVIKGGSHVIMVSHPDEVAKIIVAAASAI